MATGSSRLAAAAALGALAAVISREFAIPMDPGWIVVCWVAGAIVAWVPGDASARATYGAAATGVAGAVAANVLFAGQYAGLAWLVAAVEAAVLGHGFIVGATVRRAIAVRTLNDAWVLVGALATVGVAVLFVLFAMDLAQNPA